MLRRARSDTLSAGGARGGRNAARGADVEGRGHSSYSTTKRYIDLAGERFREEAGRLEDRLFGASGTKLRYQTLIRCLRRMRPKPQTRIFPAEGEGFEPSRRLHA